MSIQLDFFEALPDRVDDGKAIRARIIAAMSENHHDYLEELRHIARGILAHRGAVTIDDVREEMTRIGFPMPNEIGADNRILGAVFATKEFKAVTQIPTRRKERLARSGPGASYVTVYELRKADEVA
ncbi:MAG: hypothetical protein KGL39_34295 [Patescibacteria group bacterium]|nr:hypothetical protein [Patescibacteria group bacterium]